MFVNARRLLQYFQMPVKNSRHISRYIQFFFAVFLNSYVFIALFFSEPLTMFCGSLRFRGTLFERHWYIGLLVIKTLHFYNTFQNVSQGPSQVSLPLHCCTWWGENPLKYLLYACLDTTHFTTPDHQNYTFTYTFAYSHTTFL
jgi:hypothetical protein